MWVISGHDGGGSEAWVRVVVSLAVFVVERGLLPRYKTTVALKVAVKSAANETTVEVERRRRLSEKVVSKGANLGTGIRRSGGA